MSLRETTEKERKPSVIVVGIDYSALSDLALERACELAAANTRSELHVVYVEPAAHSSDTPPSSELESSELESSELDEPPAEAMQAASSQLHTHVEEVVARWCQTRAVRAPFVRLTTHVRSGSAAYAIAQLASDMEADLVVVGTHGRRGAQRAFLGSVAERTVRLAPCAVLVVPEKKATVPQIEPPCPRCLETRRATQGKELWCEQHREQHGRRHTYHYRPAPEAHQSGFLIHT